MGNIFLLLAALSGFICVAFGAFAAHILSDSLSELQLNWIHKGWNYQSFHTVALLALGFFVALQNEDKPACRDKVLKVVGYSWVFGIIGFSGTLYVMALLNTKAIAMIVPLGGIAFLIGWVTLFVVVAKNLLMKKA